MDALQDIYKESKERQCNRGAGQKRQGPRHPCRGNLSGRPMRVEGALRPRRRHRRRRRHRHRVLGRPPQACGGRAFAAEGPRPCASAAPANASAPVHAACLRDALVRPCVRQFFRENPFYVHVLSPKWAQTGSLRLLFACAKARDLRFCALRLAQVAFRGARRAHNSVFRGYDLALAASWRAVSCLGGGRAACGVSRCSCVESQALFGDRFWLDCQKLQLAYVFLLESGPRRKAFQMI